MIKALTIASNGLLNAQKRATDVALDIVISTSNKNTSSLDTFEKQPEKNRPTIPAPPARPIDGNNGIFAQHVVELKQAELQFSASSAAFKRIAGTGRQLLGTVIDDEG